MRKISTGILWVFLFFLAMVSPVRAGQELTVDMKLAVFPWTGEFPEPDTLSFISYDGKALPVNHIKGPVAMMLSGDFTLPDNSGNTLWALTVGPTNYPCEIYCNDILVFISGTWRGRFVANSFLSGKAVLPPSVLVRDGKNGPRWIFHPLPTDLNHAL